MRNKLIVTTLIITLLVSSFMPAQAQEADDAADNAANLLYLPLVSSDATSASTQQDQADPDVDAAGSGPRRGLSKHNRALLGTAKAQGAQTVTLLIAADPGKNKQVAFGIAGLGGSIGYRDEDLSYIRASVPLNQVDAAVRLPGVKYADLNEIIPLDDPLPGPSGSVPPTPQTPPGPATPNNNPYMPTGDTGAAQFMAAHPTWDGRSVTVGILDTGISLDHPSLLTTSIGERKIVDWVTFTDPFIDNDPTWVKM